MIRYRRFKFPSKAVAEPLLYASGVPVYADMYDNYGTGVFGEDNGFYHTDMLFRDDVIPSALQPYQINPLFPKHEWLDNYEGGLL